MISEKLIVTKHPNSIPFQGVLTRVDVPSDKSPAGAREHLVVLNRDAAEAALPSLIGMGVGFSADWKGHDPRQKCAVITGAWIDGNNVWVRGVIYGRDFPEVIHELSKPNVKMGMSYEMVDVHIRDMKATVWTITKTTFCGAAFLLASKAAFKDSTVCLSASASRFTGKLKFVDGGKPELVKPKTARAARPSKPR